MNNIILVGMPAAGKSTIGVLLAKSLGYDFLDTDLVIQLQQNHPLQEILDSDGLAGFLRCEEKALMTVKTKRPTVIATGGSAIFSEKGMNRLKSNGVCVYIEVPVEELKRRITNIRTRGIAAARNQSLTEIFGEREPLYKKYADITIRSDGSSIEEMVELIVAKIHNN